MNFSAYHGESISDVLYNPEELEGKRSHGTRDYPRTSGNSRHPSTQVPKKGHGHAATGSPRTLVNEDKRSHLVLSGTHRLPILGITSPFDLPEDP